MGWGVDGGKPANPERRIEGRAHHVHAEPEATQLVAIDVEGQLTRAKRQIAGDIGEARRLLDAIDETLRVVVELALVDARQRVLVERRAASAADAQIL